MLLKSLKAGQIGQHQPNMAEILHTWSDVTLVKIMHVHSTFVIKGTDHSSSIVVMNSTKVFVLDLDQKWSTACFLTERTLNKFPGLGNISSPGSSKTDLLTILIALGQCTSAQIHGCYTDPYHRRFKRVFKSGNLPRDITKLLLNVIGEVR